MKVNVCIDRSAAILAGREVFGNQQVDLSLEGLSQEQRAAVASAPIKNGVPDLTAAVGYLPDGQPEMPKLADAEPLPWLEWRVAALRTIAAQKAKEDAAFETSVERYIRWACEQPAEAFLKPAYPGASDVKVGYPAKDTFADAPDLPRDRDLPGGVPQRIREALADLSAQAQVLADARNAEVARAAQARVEAREAAEQRRAQQIAAWVAEHMDENAHERFALGLLSETEILKGMHDAMFRCMDDVPRYCGIGVDDLEHEETCCGDPPEISCTTKEAESVDAATFDAFRRIRDAAPKDWTFRLMRHRCTCDECEASLDRFSVDAAVQIGELTLQRKFAVTP